MGRQRRTRARRHLEARATQEKRIVLTERNLATATAIRILEGLLSYCYFKSHVQVLDLL